LYPAIFYHIKYALSFSSHLASGQDRGGRAGEIREHHSILGTLFDARYESGDALCDWLKHLLHALSVNTASHFQRNIGGGALKDLLFSDCCFNSSWWLTSHALRGAYVRVFS
jgi:hypothetical protein